MNCGDEIVQDLVRDVLVENAAVPEVDEVILQRLQLDAGGVGDVSNPYLAEVGQPGLRTEGGELRTVDGDLVIAVRSFDTGRKCGLGYGDFPKKTVLVATRATTRGEDHARQVNGRYTDG
jgi:hypothetical protein